ncbi:hypothetical protein BN1211_5206 [Cyberlindnera jadinii]|uniref:Cytochrome c oxidase assembly factor 3 n=1 Tax=Cyberlindnera jadinii (strain ATCC 18201 / CBS 1600 / BCRC 20928 / JCM 3617 / NBRC 0987 / NRRL Y-1542) TaxID=983966 RepID=A0A0H5C842_CYBJN|nr:hypothetical protein BN1211_5206 [Cyberlindnera jadinii]
MALQQSKYHDPRTFKMTPAMIRARRPFFWKNAATFAVLSTITVSIYAYTYSFLGKDDFSDVPIPPITEEELTKLKKEYMAEQAANKK